MVLLRQAPYLLFLLAVVLVSGCTSGLLYTHTTRPLDINHNQTQVSHEDNEGDIKYLYFFASAIWDSNAIGEIAKEGGIETIYYADIEELVILKILQYIYIGPVWRQYTVHVYGN